MIKFLFKYFKCIKNYWIHDVCFAKNIFIKNKDNFCKKFINSAKVIIFCKNYFGPKEIKNKMYLSNTYVCDFNIFKIWTHTIKIKEGIFKIKK